MKDAKGRMKRGGNIHGAATHLQYRSLLAGRQISILLPACYTCLVITSLPSPLPSLTIRSAHKRIRYTYATDRDEKAGLIDWGRLFTARTWEDIKELAKKNSIFREVGDIMGQAMTQEEDMLRRRQIAILDYQAGMHEAREDGIAEGIAEGRAERRAEDIKALMTNLGLSFEKAAAALNISAEEADRIRKQIV